MLRLFRIIRKNLIEEQRTRQYIYYAIGEILLVMVGILLALQVNNWNEEKKKAAEMITYHERLSKDIDRLMQDLETSKEQADKNYEAITTSLDALNAGVLAAGQDSVFRHFLDTYFKFALSTQKLNTFQEMQSAGKLELIQNKELLDMLAEVIDRQDFINSVNETFHQDSHLSSDYLDPYVLYVFEKDSSGDMDIEFDFNFKAMAKDRTLIRKVSRQAMLWYESRRFIYSFTGMAESLKALMDEEIERIS